MFDLFKPKKDKPKEEKDKKVKKWYDIAELCLMNETEEEL